MTLVRRALALLAAAALLPGCATTALTQGYRREHGLANDADLPGIRFYTSDHLVLQRSSALREPGSEEGAFRVSASSMVQEIVIPKGTGLMVLRAVRAPTPQGGAEVEYLQLALGADAPAKSLWFSTLRPAHAGHYELTAVAQLGEDGKPVLGAADTIRYDGLDYRLRDPGMWQVYLCVGTLVRAHLKLNAQTQPQPH